MCTLGVEINFVIFIGVYILICFEHCWWKSILVEKNHSSLSYMWFAYRNAIRINECVDSGTGAESWFLRRSSVRHRDTFSYGRCFVSGPPYKAISLLYQYFIKFYLISYLKNIIHRYYLFIDTIIIFTICTF